MIELLRTAAAESPDHLAVVTSERQLTYAALVEAAERAATVLSDEGIERFGLLEPDAAATWVLLAAAALIGAEACVYPVALAEDEPALDRLRVRLGHDTLVTSLAVSGDGVCHPDEFLATEVSRTTAEPPAVRPLLILTTGTSGHPQAVQHDWARVLRVAERIKPTPDQRWLLAYGLNQFGGLQILIHVAAARATLVCPESHQPRDGLAAIRRWGVTHASGTPTFWRFVLAELRGGDGEIPPLRQVTLGGEAVPSALIEQLRTTFADARISQIYGATEMGQNITVRDGRAGLPLSVLDSDGDVVFKIVDGELWVRSKSSMLGYYGQAPHDAESWRATGDLVEVVGDRIEFRGRKSEVINVGGVKVHPLPIEERVHQVEGVALAHAYGRSNPMVGHIVALEVVPVEGADEDALGEAIRAACANLPPAARPRSIRFVRTLETTGNKLARGRK